MLYRCSQVDQERMRLVHWLGVNALGFCQCLDTWFGDSKGIRLIKTCDSCPQRTVPEEVEKETEGNWLNQVQREAGH